MERVVGHRQHLSECLAVIDIVFHDKQLRHGNVVTAVLREVACLDFGVCEEVAPELGEAACLLAFAGILRLRFLSVEFLDKRCGENACKEFVCGVGSLYHVGREEGCDDRHCHDDGVDLGLERACAVGLNGGDADAGDDE